MVRGDVLTFSSLAPALGDASAVMIATGARDPGNLLGPFEVGAHEREGMWGLWRMRACEGAAAGFDLCLAWEVGVDSYNGLLGSQPCRSP